MIGRKVRKLSELCGNKSVDLICSGYREDNLPKIWLTLIASLSGEEIEFEETANVEDKLEETKNMIKEVKKNLKPYWESMQR